MANKKTSQENVLTKTGFTANTVMRLADGSTSDNYQTGCLDFINAITLTKAQAITLLTTPSSVVLDSMYKITTLGIADITEVIISGRNMLQGNSPAQVFITALGQYIPCEYDITTNVIGNYYLKELSTIYVASDLLADQVAAEGLGNFEQLIVEGRDYKIHVDAQGVDYILTKGIKVTAPALPPTFRFSNDVKVVMLDGNVLDGTYDVATWWLTYEREITIGTTNDDTDATAFVIGKNTSGQSVDTANIISNGIVNISFTGSWLTSNIVAYFNSTNDAGLGVSLMFGFYSAAANEITIYGSKQESLENVCWSYVTPVIVTIKNLVRVNLD